MTNLTFEKLPFAINQVLRKIEKIERILSDQENNPKTKLKDLLNIDEASEMLSLSKATLYSKVSRNEIPFMKRSKRLYFSREELTNYLKQGSTKSIDEIDPTDFLIKKGGK